MLSTAAVADLQDESTNSAVLVQRLVALSNSPTSAPNNSSCNHNDDDRDDDVGLAALDENEPPKNGDGKKAAAEIRIGPATKKAKTDSSPYHVIHNEDELASAIEMLRDVARERVNEFACRIVSMGNKATGAFSSRIRGSLRAAGRGFLLLTAIPSTAGFPVDQAYLQRLVDKCLAPFSHRPPSKSVYFADLYANFGHHLPHHSNEDIDAAWMQLVPAVNRRQLIQVVSKYPGFWATVTADGKKAN